MGKYEINELYASHALHLRFLITPNGTKEIYDAVSQCSRCGYCETVCPTYVISRRETLSPRGRNQIVRQLIEGKFRPGPDASYESLKTCLLCGACTNVCYGKVATGDIVLEARRETTGYGKSPVYKLVIKLKRNKALFAAAVKFLYLLKKAGLAALSEKLGIFYFLGMPALGEAQKKLFRAPLTFLREKLEKRAPPPETATLKWVYFASCGIDYIFTEVGLATVKLLEEIYGPGVFMKNECCGLISYNYGSLADARASALKNIKLFEGLRTRHKKFRIVGDCSSCVAFLKSYPQLFSGEEELLKRAEEFAGNVSDITELIKPEHLAGRFDPEKTQKNRVTIHDSCRACHGQGIREQQREVLRPVLGKNLVEMKESDMCCGGAGAYAFTNPRISARILARKTENISKTRADIVIASSTSCLMQIESGLREMYPSARIMHYSEYLVSIMKKKA
ncbi:MAG: hypothetical protein COT17_04185 [Elusimicrobia bacterium CG08_land_8_20_14_0_20_51_18]|nr:MAG: hypothetical protein COT17_04185 [Elusimicrobia bacterium CG08_land_8_20_14_0_20_51_18]